MRNHSYENDFDLHENEIACWTHFHMKGFALGLGFQLRHKRTWKWPIENKMNTFMGKLIKQNFLHVFIQRTIYSGEGQFKTSSFLRGDCFQCCYFPFLTLKLLFFIWMPTRLSTEEHWLTFCQFGRCDSTVGFFHDNYYSIDRYFHVWKLRLAYYTLIKNVHHFFQITFQLLLPKIFPMWKQVVGVHWWIV